MSKSTKSQFYRYTLRSVAVANRAACTDKYYLYPVPPEDALTIENLFTHFKITFDSSVPAGSRVVEAIGITNERPLFNGNHASIERLIQLDEVADGNRVVDIKIDLSDLLVKENVGFTPLFGADYETENQTFVYVKLPSGLRETLNVGTIDIWKTDILYTTREIR